MMHLVGRSQFLAAVGLRFICMFLQAVPERVLSVAKACPKVLDMHRSHDGLVFP